MKNIKILLTIFFLVFLASCSKEDLMKLPASISDSNTIQKEYITIGTFNLEWLGDGHRDRKQRDETDYKRIAELIKDLDVDILGLQEIENKKAVKRILKYLPDYKFVIGTTGGSQKLAVIFKNNIAIHSFGDYFPSMPDKRRTKAGLWLYVQAGNYDFHLMDVHFKSSSHWENTKAKRLNSFNLRQLQAKAIAKWADSILTKTKEEDVIIIGDFNDAPRKKNTTLSSLFNDSNLLFLTDDLKSCKYRAAYSIDNIIVSDTSAKRYNESSLFMFNLKSAYPSEIVKHISDHCPVTVKFDITLPDNDPSIFEYNLN